jgi:hypothetical protein
MKKKINNGAWGLVFFLTLNIVTAYAQQMPQRCAFDIVYAKKKTDPLYKNQRSVFEQKIKAIVENTNARKSNIKELIRIPVVVHVIHNNTTGTIGGRTNSNITLEQINSQIEVLNEDYRRKTGTLGFNTSTVGADLEIEFYLAQTDPDGNPSTGVIRKMTAKSIYDPTSDADQRALSALSYWPSTCYLNMWVTTLSNNYLGYAQFPAAPNFDGLDPTGDEAIDGLFIDYRYFGRNASPIVTKFYKQGRTATHEIGHWLGLIHTWGDEDCGTDYCADTPATQSANLTFVCTDKFSSCNGTRTRNMVENYMDYTIDSCMNIFTKDQSARVRAVFEASPSRKKLLECITQLPVAAQLSLEINGNPVLANIQGAVLLPAKQTVQLYLYDKQGHLLEAQEFIDKNSFYFTFANTYPPATQLILVATSNGHSQSKQIFIAAQ